MTTVFDVPYDYPFVKTVVINKSGSNKREPTKISYII